MADRSGACVRGSAIDGQRSPPTMGQCRDGVSRSGRSGPQRSWNLAPHRRHRRVGVDLSPRKGRRRSDAVMSFLAFRFLVATVVLAVIRRGPSRDHRRTTTPRDPARALPRWRLHLPDARARAHLGRGLGFITGSASCSYRSLLGRCSAPQHRLDFRRGGHRDDRTRLISLHGVVVGAGEILTLICAVFYALQIVGLGAWSNASDAYPLTLINSRWLHSSV